MMTGDGADEIARAKLNLAERALFKAGGLLGVTGSQQALQGLSKLWMPLGRRVVIVGGGLVGLELAEFLLERGREVMVLEPSDKPGRELSIVRRWRVLDNVRTHGELFTQATVEAIEAREVLWRDAQGQPQRTPADSVVLAIGAEPDHRLAESLSHLGVPVTAVGDGAQIGYIEGAMHGGHRAGREV
jgi:NADPH-dependent 2,4-dienoyl-CoA reductase/sulfur reductase-like enzyme